MEAKLPAYAERVTIALGLLCTEPPPAELVQRWLDEEEPDPDAYDLQDWAAHYLRLPWFMGITAIEAAIALASEPNEGLLTRIGREHEDEHGGQLPYLWWKD